MAISKHVQALLLELKLEESKLQVERVLNE